MLEVDDLVGGYGPTQVLHGLSISVAAGSVTALLGANGAGKTTLMKTLAGLLPVKSGCLRFLGEDITRVACNRRVLAGLVLVPEGRMVFPSLSVKENLRLGGINPRARRHWQRSLDHVYHVFPKLLERESQAAATLSGGEQQMLAIGRGLMAQPRMILLDEPTLGLSPLMAQEIFQLVRRLVERWPDPAAGRAGRPAHAGRWRSTRMSSRTDGWRPTASPPTSPAIHGCARLISVFDNIEFQQATVMPAALSFTSHRQGLTPAGVTLRYPHCCNCVHSPAGDPWNDIQTVPYKPCCTGVPRCDTGLRRKPGYLCLQRRLLGLERRVRVAARFLGFNQQLERQFTQQRESRRGQLPDRCSRADRQSAGDAATHP